MINSHDTIKFYVDTFIVEQFIRDPALIKKAAPAFIESLLEKAKNYFENRLGKSDDPVSTILDLLGPVAISATLTGLGIPGGFIAGLIMSVFGINLSEIVKSIYDKVKGYFNENKNVPIKENAERLITQMPSVVDASADPHFPTITEEEADKRMTPEIARTITANNISVQLHNVRIVKLALIQYEFEKTAGLLTGFLKLVGKSFGTLKTSVFSLLKTILSWIFRAALLVIGGHGLNRVFNVQSPSLLDKQISPVKKSTQKVFKEKPAGNIVRNQSGYWAENYNNNKSGISDMLVKFAKDSYEGLDGLEQIIMSTIGFQEVVDTIEEYNHTSQGASVVFIPQAFTTKTSIVDLFIDEVAEKFSSKVESKNEKK
jgi:hypothetical protein